MLRRAVDAVAGGLVGWRWPAKLALAAAPSEVERGHIRHACPRSKRSQVRVLSDVPPGKNPQNFRSKRSEGHFRPPVFPYSRQVVYLISGKGSDKPVRSGKAAKMTTSKRRLSGVEKRTVIDTYPTGSLRERYLLRHQARASPPATIARYCMTFLLFDRFLKATERKVKSRILTTEVMQAFSVYGWRRSLFALTTAPPVGRWRGSKRHVCLRSNRWQRPRSWRLDVPAPRRRIAARREEAHPSSVRSQKSGQEAVEQSLGKDLGDRIQRLHGVCANRRGEDTAVHNVDVRYLFTVGRPKAVIQ